MYAHIAEFGIPVEIGGLKIQPGDLMHGDCHGVHVIPMQVASRIPAMAEEILREEKQIRHLCQSPRFSLHRLEQTLEKSPGAESEVLLGRD